MFRFPKLGRLSRATAFGHWSSGGQIRTKADQADPLLEKMSGQEWISYIDRRKAFGEEAAMRWVVSKHGQK
jgi:hypothetical protein